MTTPSHRIRFLHNNLGTAAASTVTFSSAASGYPGANVWDEFRYRTWKTAGNFEITAANRNVYINDGTDKTVALTVAAYTGTTLAAHIQTQLNASSSSWTCTYSAVTGKFTIDRSAGTEVLRYSQTTNAAWDTLGFVGAVDDNSGPFVSDERRNHTSEWIKFDFGSTVEVRAALLMGLGDAVFGISSDATCYFQLNSVDDFSDPPVNVEMSVDNLGALGFSDDENSDYRYGRIVFTDRLNTVGPEGFETALAFVGPYTTLSKRNIGNSFVKALVDNSDVSESESGVVYFRRRQKYWRFDSCEIAYLEPDDRADLEQMYYDLGRSTPFFVCIDPELHNSTSAFELTKYVVFDDAPKFQHVRGPYYSTQFSLREVIG